MFFQKIGQNGRPGGWEPSSVPALTGNPDIQGYGFVHGLILRNVLEAQDCAALIQFMESSPNFEPVSVQGFKDTVDTGIGSMRTTVWSAELAQQLWQRIGPHLMTQYMNPYTPTDWWQGDPGRQVWKPIAISPLLRFMRYKRGGEHYSHYDAGFIYPDDRYRTLKSVVIYLTDSEGSGATRFIKDQQDDIPIWDRQHNDWLRQAQPEEVLYRSVPEAGKVLVFDHRRCHDVEPYTGSMPRVIIRADVVYEAVCE